MTERDDINTEGKNNNAYLASLFKPAYNWKNA
jgi:hypothetical protein